MKQVRRRCPEEPQYKLAVSDTLVWSEKFSTNNQEAQQQECQLIFSVLKWETNKKHISSMQVWYMSVCLKTYLQSQNTQKEHHKADCGMILLSYSSFVMFRKHTIPMLLALTFFLTKCQQLNVLYDNRSISLDKKKKRKQSS